MASRLSFSPIPEFSVKSFPKQPRQVPLFAIPPLGFPSKYAHSRTISSSRVEFVHSLRAVREEVVQSPNSESTDDSKTAPSSSSKLVLVVGGTGGVVTQLLSLALSPLSFPLLLSHLQKQFSIAIGEDEGGARIVADYRLGQLVVASLLNRNIKSRLILRDPQKAATLFGEQDEETLQVFTGDTRNPGDLDPSIFEGVTHVICCTGTTAFPSKRWDGDNTPERVDWEGVKNLVSALPSSVKRVVLVSSVGVTKFNELPWRAGRLTDGPYTSYDLNTLLKATAGQRRAVLIGRGDKLVGEVSRLVVAEACIQALDIEFTRGKIYEINSIEGEGPGSDQQKWRELFEAVETK
ncbi:hypothetical protein L484_001841 [Morus notabilis]|uniref:NAD(P)-binding domain-containing protein n=1 Tax=Morus notabilis TaxID=981085 RepID=W9R4I4_9ROSA|nr:hypothetical protein L484_001841 [Morus notabilis]